MSAVVVLLAGVVAYLAVPGWRADLVLQKPEDQLPVVRPQSGDRGLLRRFRPALVVLTLAGTWSLLGGPVGLVAGGFTAALAWRVLGDTEGPAARRRRRELEDDLPVAVHLLGACLEAGAATVTALDTVASALDGAVGDELRAIRMRLILGGDPVTVWQDVGRTGPLAPLGRRLARAHASGASVTAAIDRLSADLRSATRVRSEARARSVEVRAAAPLGVCLLPSFLLIGVVPMAAGIFGSLELLG